MRLVRDNIDEIFVFKAKSVQFSPILCRVINLFDGEPFVFKFFPGRSILRILRNRLSFFGWISTNSTRRPWVFEKNIYNFKITSFVCDASARKCLKVITGNGDDGGCERCSQEGVHDNGIIVWESTDRQQTDRSIQVPMVLKGRLIF
jgi:hypothetical protein